MILPFQSIGADVGHSAVKAVTFSRAGDPIRIITPSVVCPTIQINNEAEARRAQLETVTVGKRSYFIGDTAKTQGGSSVVLGLSEIWIRTPEYMALMKGTMSQIARAGGDPDNSMLVLGLPAHLFQRQQGELKEIVHAHLGTPMDMIKVIPQPMGPYQAMMVGRDGIPNQERMLNDSWGVVEVGHFTTDFMLVKRGRWVERASGTCSGIRVAAEHLMKLLNDEGITADLMECEEALQTRTIKNYGKVIDATAMVDSAVDLIVSEILDTATRLLEHEARSLTGVIVAGGGASFVFPSLNAKWPHASLIADARFAVAHGMHRLGLALLHSRRLSMAAQGESA